MFVLRGTYLEKPWETVHALGVATGKDDPASNKRTSKHANNIYRQNGAALDTKATAKFKKLELYAGDQKESVVCDNHGDESSEHHALGASNGHAASERDNYHQVWEHHTRRDAAISAKLHSDETEA